MILGTGIDMVQVDRFRSWLGNEAKILRFFSPEEYSYIQTAQDPAASLAARFAAREALGKALGRGLRGLVLKDLAVVRGEGGIPRFQPGDEARLILDRHSRQAGYPAWRIHLSMSHEREYALAQVIIEGALTW